MSMKTYNFKLVIERDDKFDGNPSGWHAYCPALGARGASTWGDTPEAAVKNIDEVVHFVVETMLEHGEHITEERPDRRVFVERATCGGMGRTSIDNDLG